MRRGLRSGAALGCLLAFLLFPNMAFANQVTDVQVDCDGNAVLVTGNGFGVAGGPPVKVTVSGPQGYLQSFEIDVQTEWTVSLPLGPSGDYSIDWPDGGPVTFSVDCPAATASPTPTPTPAPSRTAHPSKSPAPPKTLPPTDTTTLSSGPAPAASDTALATLFLIGVLAASVAVRRTAYRRNWRR